MMMLFATQITRGSKSTRQNTLSVRDRKASARFSDRQRGTKARPINHDLARRRWAHTRHKITIYHLCICKMRTHTIKLVSRVVTRKFHMPMVAVYYLALCHLLLRPDDLLVLVSSQPTTTTTTTTTTMVSSNQCLSAPCEYVAECRDQMGTCGDTTAHCNSESIWVPACGGGGGIYKPSTMDTAATSPAPMMTSSSTPPLMMPTTTATETNTMPTRQILTSEPTTAWEAWLSGEENADQDKGVIGLTTGNEGKENYTQTSNGTTTTDSWFNGDTWQNGRNDTKEEDESLLDKIDFWSNSDSSSSPSIREKFNVEWMLLLLPMAMLFYRFWI